MSAKTKKYKIDFLWLKKHRITLAWLSLITQAGIILTGGAVRVTGSGLGCTTWPKCTAESWFPTPEMQIHGLIEFGNRTLTFVLILVALLTFLSVIPIKDKRKDLLKLSFILGLTIIVQAVVGGITVIIKLNPYIVGIHFLISAIGVVLASCYVYFSYHKPVLIKKVQLLESDKNTYHSKTHIACECAGKSEIKNKSIQVLLIKISSIIISVCITLTTLIGILTTGAGPHAGDAKVKRNGFNPEALQHLHANAAYTLLASIIATIILLKILQMSKALTALLQCVASIIAQIIIGIIQARTGVPIILVLSHMIMAAVCFSLLTRYLLKLSWHHCRYEKVTKQ